MQQKVAFLWAGATTAVVVASLTLITGMWGVLPANAATTASTTNTAVDAQAAANSEQAGGQTQQSLQEQTRQRIAAIDAEAQPKLKAMLQQADTLATSAEQKQQEIAALHEQIATEQAAIAHDAESQQQAIAALQAQEMQMRGQLAEATAQLQVAYALLTAQQGGQMSGDHTEYNDDHEDRDHHEGGAEDGEYEHNEYDD